MTQADPGSADKFRYWAFISYSHQDKEWGDWLHKAMETYRVPRRLVGKPSRDGIVPKRAFPVFRDREELPGSSSLGDNISEALRASRYLIVICSPRSAVSRWVNQEIKSYKAMGGEERVLCLIVEGEPNASAKPELGLLECFPEAVRFRVNAAGEITNEPTEPIAADARPGKDGKANAKLKLLSGVIGVAYDELKQRDKQRKIRRRIQMVAASVLICGLMAGIFGWKEAQRRKEERASASKSDLAMALKALDQGNVNQALAWLARSLRIDPENAVARSRLVSLLSQRNWALPAAAPMSHAKAVTAAQFSPDGKRVATASEDGTICVWDSSSGKPITEPIAHRRAVMVDFSPDGTRLLSAGQPDARFWNPATGEQNGPALKHDRALQMARFAAGGSRVVTASVDGTARLWDAGDGHSIFEPLPHSGPVMRALISPDARQVVTATVLQGARLWDATTGAPLGEEIKLKSIPFSLEYSSDGTQLLCAGNAAEVLTAATLQPAYPPLAAEGVRAARFSPDGKIIFTASFDKNGRFWDAATGQPVLQRLEHNESLVAGAFSRDGERVITGTAQGSAYIWEVKTGRVLSEAFQQNDELVVTEFSPDGTRALTASKDGNAQIWDATARGLAPLSMDADERVLRGEFDASSRQLTTIAKEGAIQVWDVATGKLLRSEKQPALSAASTSADGTRRGVMDGLIARIIDTATNKQISADLEHPLPLLALSLNADGTRVATSCVDKGVRVWDVASGKVLFDAIKHPELVRTVAFSHDGKRLVTGCFDKAARVWDAESGRALLEPIWHGAIVDDAQFSSDGARIVTASLNGRAQIWNASTGELLGEPYQHEGEGVQFVRLSPDGRWLATSVDKKIFIWDALRLPEKTPPWLADIAEAVGGSKLNSGNLIMRAGVQWQLQESIRSKVIGKASDPFARWAEWLLQSSDGRTVSPFMEIKRPVPPSSSSPPVPAVTSVAAPASISREASEGLMFVALVQHGIFNVETVKDPALATQSYERALPLAKRRVAAEPQNFSAQNELVTLLNLTGESYAMQGDAMKALDLSREAVQLCETLLTSAPGAQPRKLLAQSLSSLAFCQNMLKQSGDAITSGLRALEVDPASVLSKINLATAYVLTGQYPLAEPILVEIKDLKTGTRRSGDVVVELLDDLKKRGIDHPDAGKVRELVRATGDR
jgi:WD40 repeat protein/tetratricopeptide (TPR) repeat protein